MKRKTDTPPLRRLSFETMRALMDRRGLKGIDGIFLKNDIAMARSAKPLIKNFASAEPFYLDDARLGIVRKGHCHYSLNLMETDFPRGRRGVYRAGQHRTDRQHDRRLRHHGGGL